MKIGFLLPANFAVGGPGNGVRIQAAMQADALERAGETVVRLNPWEIYDLSGFDVIQFFQGGFATFGIGTARSRRCRLIGFAPIIDSNEPNYLYRMASWLGRTHRKVFTIPEVFRQQAIESDFVICRSRHERDRLVTGLGIPQSKVEIVLNGVVAPAIDLDISQNPLSLPKEFVLHVSAYTQERKNVLRLVEAVGPTGIPLVIAGSAVPGPILDTLEHYANQYSNIKLLGFVDGKSLLTLYATCKVFCLPSIHEGTGLAALEAGSMGASVVVTRKGGTSDYFSNKAKYVDPYDVKGIRKAVMRAWEEPRSSGLQEHILKNLTWDQSAAALINVYRRRLAI